MKKLAILSIAALSMASCTKNIEDYNKQTKAPSQVPAAPLFSNAVRSLTDLLTSSNVNTNVYRLVVQHWTTTTYTDEPNYDFFTRNIPGRFWTFLYRDVLADLKECKRLIPATPGITAGAKANQAAIVDIMQVYTWSVLVSTYGNVPYSQALDINNLFPEYDDAKTIYSDLLTKLDAAIATLNVAEKGFDVNQDLVYGGGTFPNQVEQWAKFANSLKIRMAMLIADTDDAKAKAAVEAADAKAFSSAADNAIFRYQSTTPNQNPIWTDLVQSKRQDFIASSTLIDKLKELSDPRLKQYFRPNDNGDYVGGINGSTNTFALFAKASNKLVAIDFPSMLLDYVETEFFRAEAKERGYNVAGTAEEHYKNAIRASIRYWGGTDAEADLYLLRPDVAYTTAAGNWKQKIGTQKWLAMYNRGFETWTEVRRLDFPVLAAPTSPKSGYPTRFTYPSNEQTLNNKAYKAAAAAIGGDKVDVKLFWDKF